MLVPAITAYELLRTASQLTVPVEGQAGVTPA